MAVQILKRRFTIEEYYQMAQAGILAGDERVELLDGEIVEMAPISSRHAACVDRLNRLFSRLVGERALVRVQNPIRLGQHTEPQPDVALVRPRPDFYAQAHPRPEDILLVIEVAETSLDVDRGIKGPLYAGAGIPEMWLVALSQEYIEVNREPTPQGYRDVRRFQRGQQLRPVMIPEQALSVDDILG